MAKVTFTGDPLHPGEKESIFIQGMEFAPGKAVELPDDHTMVKKLAENSHFKVSKASASVAVGVK